MEALTISKSACEWPGLHRVKIDRESPRQKLIAVKIINLIHEDNYDGPDENIDWALCVTGDLPFLEN